MAWIIVGPYTQTSNHNRMDTRLMKNGEFTTDGWENLYMFKSRKDAQFVANQYTKIKTSIHEVHL